MKLKIFLIAFAALVWFGGFSLALQTLTLPNTHVTGTTITAAAFNQNNDTIRVVYNRQKDSLENRFVRFTDFKDSTMDTVKCKYAKVTDSVKVKYIATTDSIKNSGHLIMTTPSTKFIYFGNTTDSNTIRMGVSGDSIVWQKYNKTSWVKIGGF